MIIDVCMLADLQRVLAYASCIAVWKEKSCTAAMLKSLTALPAMMQCQTTSVSTVSARCAKTSGEGDTPLQTPTPRRLRRLDFLAYGAQAQRDTPTQKFLVRDFVHCTAIDS